MFALLLQEDVCLVALIKVPLGPFFDRLSEPNMAYVSGQLEELYMRSSRKDMNDTLTEVLLAACVTPALMPDRLLMEHVLLISILHYSVGLEVNTPLSVSVKSYFN